MCALVTGVQSCALPIFDRQDVCCANAGRDGNARCLEFGYAAPADQGIGIAHGDDHASRPGGNQGIHTRRRAAKMAAWLECDIDRGTGDIAATLGGLSQSHDFGMRRSEEHTSELQSLMRISYAVFCYKKQKNQYIQQYK